LGGVCSALGGGTCSRCRDGGGLRVPARVGKNPSEETRGKLVELDDVFVPLR